VTASREVLGSEHPLCARLFGESAASALRAHGEFCIVRITLPQLRAKQFLQAFRTALEKQPDHPRTESDD